MDYDKVGQRIKENRLLLRMTQEQLAEKAERTVHYVSQIENARRKPSLETIVNISNALNVPIDSLIQDSLKTSETSDQIEMLEIRKILSGKSKSEIKAVVDVLKVMVQFIKV